MDALLAEAVAQLRQQPGQTYRATIEGCEVEVRKPAEPPTEERSQFEDMVMLNMFLDIPPSPRAIFVRAVPGELFPPDPPIIPHYEDGEFDE
jgi:hypothetical protein